MQNDKSFLCFLSRKVGSFSLVFTGSASSKAHLTFIRAVSEGTRAADGPRSLLQGGCTATQRVTFSVQVEGVLGRDAVGAAHRAGACWQVVLVDVGRAHCMR